MTPSPNTSLRALALVWVLGAASLARADRNECVFDTAGNRVCPSSVTCSGRRDCLGARGVEDRFCQTITTSSGTADECVPDCSTLFACTSDADCPTIGGISPSCAGVSIGPSICTWRAPDAAAMPLAAQVTYCTAAGFHIPIAKVSACHTLPGASGLMTTDYFHGDCDGDGCANGHDTDPCTPSAACDILVSPFESPFCAHPPALACDVIAGRGFVCEDARPCDPMLGSTANGCSIGTCESGWSDAPRCRPPCSTLFLCVPGALPGGGAPREQCPQLDGADGQCVALPSGVPSIDGRDGVCIYTDFFDTSCVGATVSSACFDDPSGALTTNFFAGDCDGDGAPNGCDAMRCASGGGTSTCVGTAGAGCTPSYTAPDAGLDEDAGVDAGSAPLDGGPTRDAAPTGDASTLMDAATPISSGSQVSFGGGGGCRCGVIGGRARTDAGVALVLALLAITIERRRLTRRV